MGDEPAAKRRRLSDSSDDLTEIQVSSNTDSPSRPSAATAIISDVANLTTLTRPISPPARRSTFHKIVDLTSDESVSETQDLAVDYESHDVNERSLRVSSPIQLTRVEGLTQANNVDTVSLRDLVGSPLIKECWVFNYLFDVEYLMSKFDEDIRDQVQVKIVHGSWKKDDSNRLGIEEAVKQHPNVQSITAYMPEAFGTHHTKMIINIRHDDSAEIIILTANMIAMDFKMCQAVWRSPLLAFRSNLAPSKPPSKLQPIGSGLRFGHDIMSYLKQYGARLRGLTSELEKYSFKNVRAALVASVPGRQNLRSIDPEQETLWGWAGLENVLRSVPASSHKQPHIVMQVSSVASLGAGDKWLRDTFEEALATTKQNTNISISSLRPRVSLVFPTADTIRRSVNGYGSGSSIHLKSQTTQAAKQVEYLLPMLCHWAGDPPRDVNNTSDGVTIPDPRTAAKPTIHEAGRRRAAPHIKTYIRFADKSMTSIDWAMMTSANLSTQAWGAKRNAADEVRVCSYEVGVVVWPSLWDDQAEMVPVFGKDIPDEAIVIEAGTRAFKAEEPKDSGLDENPKTPTKGARMRVGLRMPYDLPLVPYKESDTPWCAALPDVQPDWKGRSWPGYGS